MQGLESLNVKIFADGADLEGMISLLRLVSFKWRPVSDSRRSPVPLARVLGSLGVPVTDSVTSNRPLVPILDLEQHRFKIVTDSFLPLPVS